MTASGSRIAEALLDPAAYLSVCECGKVNPKFGEDQPGGHFVDCFWDHERDVRTDCASILAAMLTPERLARAITANWSLVRSRATPLAIATAILAASGEQEK